MSTHDVAVLVAVHRMDANLLGTVTAACDALGLRVLPWLGEDTPLSRVLPGLVVSALGLGERRIPDDIIGLINGSMPGAPLLLLSTEPLVDSAVSLQDGRVTLVGVPLTRERVQMGIRMLISRGGGDTRAPTEAALVASRERLRQRWWVARLAGRPPSAAAVGRARPELRLPPLHQARGEGLTALLTTPDVDAFAEGMLRDVVRVVASSEPPETKAAALAATLRRDAGVVHLSPGADEWTFYWPGTWPLWLLSPLRLPNRWNLAASVQRAGGAPLLRMMANAEDLVVATTEPPDAGDPDPIADFAEGGPAVLEALERQLNERPTTFSAVLAMVRR